MKLNNIKKLKYNKYQIEGECSFCHIQGEWPIVINMKREKIFNRKKNNGAVFIWNAKSGIRKKDFIKYLLKENINEKKEEILNLCRIMVSCPKCFRKKK